MYTYIATSHDFNVVCILKDKTNKKLLLDIVSVVKGEHFNGIPLPGYLFAFSRCT